MRLRAQTRAALRALLDLSLHGAFAAPVPVSDIAQRQGLGVPFLEQLFRPLKRAKLVAPIRGMKGGYTLARPAEDISLGDILKALDEPLVRPAGPGDLADDAEGRALAGILARADAGLDAILANLSLAELRRIARADPGLKAVPARGTGFRI